MKVNALHLVSIFALAFFIASCSKAGLGGNGSISGICYHHFPHFIPGDSVCIKYGAKNLPGVTVADYDNMIRADSTGYFIFKGLKKGNYYIYAFGFDTAIARPVTGGIPIVVKNNSDNENGIQLPITEGD